MTEPRLQAVGFSEPGGMAASFQHVRVGTLPVEEVVARLKEKIIAADLWVLHEIDPQMLLHRGGYDIGPVRQILFFHPRLMSRLLAADSAALLEAPLKFAVIGFPEGRTELRWLDPARAFARYGSPALTALGEELAGNFEAIVGGLGF
ncbi:DUF302 domain-containing protein [Bradyrhizobium guangdongense]|uniref:DUF302 domain-containing protein n=1 Tax=Bradyrhizobium guangdongense TaxID=1325090 RepID=A0A410V040_9BRAD|nr:DUF302 domain-containing protein [Bradyrhizobium guangdongense]QAU37033.1 hypothetical protein X265_04500 [Bradyrhizobium guangdongense]QOZ58088.1 hypothetical protein XH86_04500 [Bradyrhizobium guangdongense]GGI32829.1 hypothetical protein GCM10010987_71370 [Bradyrhizobium guangdongense]